MVDFLLVLIGHFSTALTVEALWADICRNSCVRKEGGSLWAQISGGMGRRPPTTVGFRKLRVPALSRGVVYVMIRLAVLTQYRRVPDDHTDTHDDG